MYCTFYIRYLYLSHDGVCGRRKVWARHLCVITLSAVRWVRWMFIGRSVSWRCIWPSYAPTRGHIWVLTCAWY